MDPRLETMPAPAVNEASRVAMLFPLHNDDPQQARAAAAQQLLFAPNPRDVCRDIGLNWWAALKLYEDGWLSFSPENTQRLDEGQESELRFIGSLVVAGCDRSMLLTLLANLPRPYSYRLNRMYFDWPEKRWRLLPEPHPHPETVFTDWLENLVEDGDHSTLSGIVELTHDALNRLRLSKPAH